MILHLIIFAAGLISGTIVMIVFTAARLNEIEMKNLDKFEQGRQRFNN